MADHRVDIDRILSPVSRKEFFETYWGQNVLHIPRNDPAYYNDILTFEDVNEYLSRTDLRYPFIRMVHNGRELPLDNYGYDYVFGENIFQGNLNTDKIFGLYKDGATMCLQMQHMALPKLTEFTNRLEGDLGFKTQSTLFLTPPSSQGFTAHYDSHDFFIFQIYGEKVWNLYDTAEALPLARTKVLDTDVRLEGSTRQQTILRPGDLLYVPRGVYHDALTNNGTSLQISLGIFPPLWVDVLHSVIDELADQNVAFRRAVSLPALQPDADIRKGFNELIDLIATLASPERTLEQIKANAIAKQPPLARNRLWDLEKKDQIDERTLLRRRDISTHVMCENGTVTVTFFDKEMKLPAVLEEHVRFVSATDSFYPVELPAGLDADGRIEFVKLFVEEGLLEIV